MANNISGLPWNIDTASNTTVKLGLAYVRGFVFSGYASGVDQCIITGLDGQGNTITIVTLDGNADLSAVSFDEGLPVWVRNLTVPTITSGKLQIFV